MCGIAGVMSKDGGPPQQAVLSRLVGALAHRGPDGHGHYVCDDVGMVHTRLAIIDLATGDQPLFARHPNDAGHPNGGGRPLALIANGEIYNDLDLRAALDRERFATRSDCEPPLHLYLRHGEAFADHLRGMFAIAIHEPRRTAGAGGIAGEGGRLVLARDPFGIKPLYFVETGAAFAFASEPQALIAAGLIPAVLRAGARDEMLQLQFTTGRSTAFAGIERVLPGETLVVEHGHIVRRLHRPALPPGPPQDMSEEHALAALDAVLADTVGLHQRSDVPYGVFLSGGIDSAVILTAMGRFHERPLVAFTAGFSNTGVHDERAAARALAEALGAEHVEITFSEADFWRLLPQVAACMDDPAADYAALPSFKLAAAARQAGIKVVLTGEGGDEMFAGYGRYRRAMRPRLLGGRAMRSRGAFDGMRVLRTDAPWRDGLRNAEAAAEGAGRTRLQIAQAADCAEWLPNDLLIKLDRCLMAHGIEGRVPLVDPVVAALAFRLPDRLKVGDGLGKRLLRRWLERNQPAARPFARKQGFTVPVAAWLAGRAMELAPLLAAQDPVQEACRPGSVERLLDAASRGNARAGRAAWNLLFFALWYRRHIAGLQPEADVFATLAP
jgi:asparagine synthase (glutamine-hydrolysing)